MYSNSLYNNAKSLEDQNWAYYLGYTFQFWNGPKPPSGHEKYQTVMQHLRRIYHSYNIIAEIVDHYKNALVGKPFNWYLTSNGEPIEEGSQIEELLQRWWDRQKRLSISQDLSQGKPLAAAVAQMLVRDNGDGVGCGYLRLYTPTRFLPLPEPYQRIVLHCPTPGSVAVERDDDGILYRATYNYNQGSETYELLDSGKTKITDVQGERELNLGGRLPVFELRGDCLITEALKQSQNSINKTLTLKDENINVAGFLERVITNAQMPGKWVQDPTAVGGERFIPEPNAIEMGANKITWLQGVPIGDPKNPSGYTSPNITYRQPVDVSAFSGNLSIDRTCAYMAAGLGHLLSAGDGSLSGVSRETIKQDFLTRLEGYSEIIEAVLSDVFSVVLTLLDKSAMYDPVIELNLASGDPLPEERAQNIQEYSAGLISRTTAMSRAGINDPDGEAELIKREREEDMEQLALQTQVQAAAATGL